MTTHTETAAATRDALAALWLPTASVLAIVERADDLGCLDEPSRAWLGRVKAEQVRQAERRAQMAKVVAS